MKRSYLFVVIVEYKKTILKKKPKILLYATYRNIEEIERNKKPGNLITQ